MTKREIVSMAKAAQKADGIIEVVATTEPRLNKYARGKKDKDGKRIACPFEGVTKRTVFKFDLNAKYQPVVKEGGEKKVERKAWTKPTDFTFLKESVDQKGKLYLFGKVVSAKSEWFMGGKKIQKTKLADYLPAPKEDAEDEAKEVWITVGIKNIQKAG